MRCKYCHNPETWNLVTDYTKLYADTTDDKEREELEKKIEESIDNFIDKRIELSKKRQAVIDNLKLENISIKVIPLGHLAEE